ncbi:hypothetical protein DFP72DRAFT_826256 [Ephemerocybe angulata]|uniref:Uncharacterized protein n=1 Tax=Ephemerocybe angulata TaxID=980116 RepID=A0A8H6HDJ1_9AGAR|nr:hypothetical protein DFP72DRAFT_826256 [Tulosesus angulatus]
MAYRSRTDPLVHYGRHFGRTIRTFYRIQPLLKNGITRNMQLETERISEADLSPSELTEHKIYKQLLGLSPSLEERLSTGSEHDIFYIADMLTKGADSARADDTKSLKSVIVDWITPPGGVLMPPIQRNIKTDRGFHHPRTGELLCPVNLDWNDPKIRRELVSGQLVPSGDLWPRFLFQGYEYNPSSPWTGLFRSSFLVSAYRHVFTSPSSVYNKGASRATRSCNARIHGMKSVTAPSIAYIATQVRFGLSACPAFSRSDRVTDSEYFYNLVVELLEDPEEEAEVADLLVWWNRQIFPTFISDSRSVHQDSVISKIKERRRLLQDKESSESNAENGPEPVESSP